MNSCEFVSLITSIACVIAKDKSVDELNLLSTVFSQLGDTLATIAAKESCDNWFFILSQISTHFSLLLCYKGKEVFTLKKLATITVSVFKSDDNITDFHIETDNDNVLPVSYVIEDTLKLY